MTRQQPVIEDWPLFLGGDWVRTSRTLEVHSPFDGSLVGQTFVAGEAELERAIEAAKRAAPVLRDLPVHRRAAILRATSDDLARRRDPVARVLAAEAGKPLKEALTEVDRAVMTFQVAAEEARRLGGDVLPLDLAPHGEGRMGLTRRFPIGPIAAISPFNFPLNLVAHKVAPAIAAGNPVVLKPSTRTPLSALGLAATLERAGLPAGAASVLPLGRELGDRLVTDDRFKLLTFTGSSAVGWRMKARAGKKKVILELGGNAGVILDESGDLELAASRIAAGGFSFAGQSCISVQRVYVHDSLFEALATRLVSAIERLRVGDPLDPETDIGPLITPDDVERVDAWVREAVAGGARVLTGGRPLGRTTYAPTLVADAPADSRLCAAEVFGPVVGLYRFDRFEEALDAVNRSDYGLQAGIFTRRLDRAFEGFARLEVGGVLINEVPTFRLDHLPYGGVKDSGLGREGPRYTIEEMTEPRLLILNLGA